MSLNFPKSRVRAFTIYLGISRSIGQCLKDLALGIISSTLLYFIKLTMMCLEKVWPTLVGPNLCARVIFIPMSICNVWTKKNSITRTKQFSLRVSLIPRNRRLIRQLRASMSMEFVGECFEKRWLVRDRRNIVNFVTGCLHVLVGYWYKFACTCLVNLENQARELWLYQVHWIKLFQFYRRYNKWYDLSESQFVTF